MTSRAQPAEVQSQKCPQTDDRPPPDEDDSERQRQPADRTAAAGDSEHQATTLQKLGAELLGTFALTLVAAGSEVVEAATGVPIGRASKMIAPGLLVMVAIHAIGGISGAHINPAVTFAFGMRRDCPWRHMPGYWIAQFAGAIAAALCLKLLFPGAVRAGALHQKLGAPPVTAFAVETILTFLLVFVILATAKEARITGPNAAIAVGATIALCGLFAGPVSGASMNPARSLGPAIVGGSLSEVWIFIAGPAVGALLAVVITWLLHGPPNPEERKAGQGEQQ